MRFGPTGLNKFYKCFICSFRTPLVPVISFGETDLYDQIENSWILQLQQKIRKVTGIAPVIFFGRGLFQYSFGIVPRRHPVTTVGMYRIMVNK